MARPVLWLALSAALLAIASAVACRQLVGISDSPPEDRTSAVCGLPYGTNACASCASASCCSESTACAADRGCAGYESCFGNCNGDPKCWAQCLADFPASGADVTALSVCMATHCESQCSLTCGALAATNIEPDAAVTCQSCLANKACDETRACARSSDCDALQRCSLGCTTHDCANTCSTAHGVDPAYTWEIDGGNGGIYGSFYTAASSCVAQCGLDRLWSCVGHESWPTAASAKDTFHFWVKDYSTGNPVGGVDVALCAFTDVACGMPLATATTGTAGSVSLPFQNAPNIAGQQGFGLNGFLMVTSPSTRPGYYYWGFPLSQAGVYLYGYVTALDEFQQISASINVVPDPRRGTVSVDAYTCSDLAGVAAGVQVTLDTADALTQAFTPSGAATTTTDATGTLVFTNVPAGNVQITVTPMGLTRPSSQVAAQVRAGATTSVLAFAH